MASNPLQGKKIYFRISPDAGTTYYVLVCMIKSGLTLDIPVQETETQCETLVGLGTQKVKFPVEGALNTDPAAPVSGIGEASSTLLLTWATAQTSLIVQQFLPDTAVPTTPDPKFYRKMSAYLTNYKEDVPVNDIVKFTAEFSGFGTLDIAP